MVFLAVAFIFSVSVVFAKSENAGGKVLSANERVRANASSTPDLENDNNSQENEDSETDAEDKDELTSETHRSAVADFVQTLLKTADKEKGIGEKVREIAKQQERDEATTTDAIKKVANRSKIKTFLIGSDYKNLGALRSEIVKTRNRIQQLENMLGDIKNASSTDEIKSRIQALKSEQTKIESFIKSQEGKFSMFGWLVKIFTK